MKKEKQVKSYQRRTKSGKVVTVKAHTAKYDAADKKEMTKKKGAGEELEERKKAPRYTQMEIPFEEEKKKVEEEVKEELPEKKEKKKPSRPINGGTNGPSRKPGTKPTPAKPKKSATKDDDISAADFKEWYRGTGSDADKRVAKILRAKLGRTGYRKLEDEAIDNYTSRGHLSMHKRLGGMFDDYAKKSEARAAKKEAKTDKKVKTPSSVEKKTTKSSKKTTSTKDVHPKNLTDEQIKDMMRKSGKYAFKKNGEIWYKSNGKQMWKTSVDSYRKDLIDERREKSAGENLKKYAKEYGFSVKDAPMLAMFGSRPKRKMSEVSAKAVRNYSRFEDISPKRARLELMMVSDKEHNKWDTYKD